MTQASERYQAVKAIAGEAADLEESKRAAFVRSRCAGDEGLEREVLWLLEAMRTDGSFLEHSPARPEPSADAVMEVQAPRNYRIVRRLGEGGHGVVMLAERSDGTYRQLVALKLLNFAGKLSPTVAARFALERQILGRLTHPNIALLIDGGTLPDGSPFLAMEYVDGLRIDEYCRQHELGTRARLELFLKVCAAVAYAHQQLVIHRDLKPANILVTAAGEPKLLDFGVARLLESADQPAAPPTVDGQRLMTPLYASPEQLRGEPLTTTSDVYSLGVLLYELLTGMPPFVPTDGDVTSFTRGVCDTEPERPSRRVAAARRRTGVADAPTTLGTRRIDVPADLDAIVMKALRKAPEDRYAGVHVLADDVQRFLDRRPVLARRGRGLYRMRRFLVRNRWGVAAAATFVVLVTAFAVDRQMQLDRVETERELARQISATMMDGFEVLSPLASRERVITARQVLDTTAARVARTMPAASELRGRLLNSIGRAYHQVGAFERAAETYTLAAANWRTLGAEFRNDEAASRAALANAYGELDQPDAAQREARAAVGLLDDTASTEVRVKVLLARATGSPPDERRLYLMRALEAASGNTRLQADAHATIAAQLRAHDPDTASVHGKRALELTSELSGGELTRMRALGTLGFLALRRGALEEAREYRRQSVELARTVYGENSVRYATQAYAYAGSLIALDDYPAAERVLRQAVAFLATPAAAGHEADLFRAEANLQTTLQMQGKYDDSAALLASLEQRAQKLFGPRSAEYAYVLWSGGNAALDRKAYDEATRKYVSALDILAPLGQVYLRDRAQIHQQLAAVNFRTGDFAEAEAQARRSLALTREFPNAEPWTLAMADVYLQMARVGQGRAAEGNAAIVDAYQRTARGADPCDGPPRRMRELVDDYRPAIPRLASLTKPLCPASKS